VLPGGSIPYTFEVGRTEVTNRQYHAFLTAVAVGSYTLSVGPYGAFDMGGNLREWVNRKVATDQELHGDSFAGAGGKTSINGASNRRNPGGSRRSTPASACCACPAGPRSTARPAPRPRAARPR
jgi:formylglycine-generating enzyme required for sulfatase activity